MKVLVTGGTGLVGSNVIKVAQERYGVAVVASLFLRQPAVPWQCSTVPMDLEDGASVRRAVEGERPDAVIHCAAPRDEDRLEVDHEWGWRVMVEGTRWLAEACRDVSAKLIFVSSDWVFGRGGQPPYDEGRAPCPANYFGLLKAVGEALVLALCENSAVVRIAGVYGPNWSDPSYEAREAGVGFGWLANHFVYRLGHGEPVSVWTDHVNVLGNPSLASDVADALLSIAHQEHRGLFHCCGRDAVSRLELARTVAAVFGFDPHLVRAAKPEEMSPGQLSGKLTAPRDSRLQVSRSEARLGRTNLGLVRGLEEYRCQLEEISKEVRHSALDTKT
jgi:dTDP-4-dehydrorhamnose reductase